MSLALAFVMIHSKAQRYEFSEKKQYIFLQPESANLEHFFDGLNTLKQEEADTCKGLLLVTLTECNKLLNNTCICKTPGSNDLL